MWAIQGTRRTNNVCEPSKIHLYNHLPILAGNSLFLFRNHKYLLFVIYHESHTNHESTTRTRMDSCPTSSSPLAKPVQREPCSAVPRIDRDQSSFSSQDGVFDGCVLFLLLLSLLLLFFLFFGGGVFFGVTSHYSYQDVRKKCKRACWQGGRVGSRLRRSRVSTRRRPRVRWMSPKLGSM